MAGMGNKLDHVRCDLGQNPGCTPSLNTVTALLGRIERNTSP
jgi:hypothetical protein